ncbi:MAG: glycosyltransferase family 39 protein [Chloroflexota bacterium]|nr:glycosyltransferase family 39 protein [Chloroflexota bacterium]
MIGRAEGHARSPGVIASSAGGAVLNGSTRHDRLAELRGRSRSALPWMIPTLLFGFGLALRLPHLWTIPTLTDEANEVLRGLAVAEGRLLPLTNVNTYLGSFYNYLLATVFLAVGPSIFAARALVALAGALTVPATFLLLRELGAGRGLAVIGTALLATSGTHIVVSSHVAWAHSLTPLASTLGLWLLARALHRDRSRLLVLAGLALGLAVQTHTSAIALVPGAAVYAVIRRPAWLRTPWPYLAVLAFLAVNANLIAFTAFSRGESFAEAQDHVRSYARSGATGADLYRENLGKLGLTFGRMVAGAVDVRESAAGYLADPTMWTYAALLMLGLVWGATRGSALPLLVLVPYVLALPLVNSKFEVIPNGRFLAPLLPVAYAAVAIGLGALFALARQWPRPPVHRWAFPLVAGALVLWPLYPLAVRYEQMAESERTSITLMGALATLEARHKPGEWVALDPDLDKLWLDAGGDYLVAFRYLLTMRSIPNQELEFRRRSERGNLDSCDTGRVELRWVMPERSPDATRLFADDPATPDDESRRPYWQIRTVQRSDRARDAQRGQSDEWSAVVATYAPPLYGSSRAVDRCVPRRPI